jgi:type II secretory pathway predicted ATPase ExeA
VNDSPHAPIGFQLAELLRQHLLGDRGYRALEVGEAQNLAAEQMEQDQQLPPAFDELERLLDAVRRGKRSVFVSLTPR